MAAHACLKNEFTEDEKCHNLMRWLNACFSLFCCCCFCEPKFSQISHKFITKALNFLTSLNAKNSSTEGSVARSRLQAILQYCSIVQFFSCDRAPRLNRYSNGKVALPCQMKKIGLYMIWRMNRNTKALAICDLSLVTRKLVFRVFE